MVCASAFIQSPCRLYETNCWWYSAYNRSVGGPHLAPSPLLAWFPVALVAPWKQGGCAAHAFFPAHSSFCWANNDCAPLLVAATAAKFSVEQAHRAVAAAIRQPSDACTQKFTHRRRRMCYLSGVCARERVRRKPLAHYTCSQSIHTTYPLTSTAPPPCTPPLPPPPPPPPAINSIMLSRNSINPADKEQFLPAASAIGDSPTQRISLGAGWREAPGLKQARRGYFAFIAPQIHKKPCIINYLRDAAAAWVWQHVPLRVGVSVCVREDGDVSRQDKTPRLD